MEARPATSLRSPTTPSPQEVAQHNLTHMPDQSWCPICVQSKGQHHRHQHQHSTIQLDYCFMHNPHVKLTSLAEKPKNITILTMVETITSLSRQRKGQHNIRYNISNVLSPSTASPTPSSRPTARMPSRNSPNKLHNLVFQ